MVLSFDSSTRAKKTKKRRKFKSLEINCEIFKNSFTLFILCLVATTSQLESHGRLVALQRLAKLIVLLVQHAQIEPRSKVCAIKLYGAYERLQCVHVLLLLMIEHANWAPSVTWRLRVVDAVLVGDEGFARATLAGESASQVVPCQILTRVELSALAQVFNAQLERPRVYFRFDGRDGRCCCCCWLQFKLWAWQQTHG